jgi:hypothetical protein
MDERAEFFGQSRVAHGEKLPHHLAAAKPGLPTGSADFRIGGFLACVRMARGKMWRYRVRGGADCSLALWTHGESMGLDLQPAGVEVDVDDDNIPF